jgi:hypothetical protein
MKPLKIKMTHYGAGNVRFNLPEIDMDHRPVLLFKTAGTIVPSTPSFLRRWLGIDLALFQIIWDGLKSNGSINLYGKIDNDVPDNGGKKAVCRYDFNTSIQADCDIVCKVDRRMLDDFNFSKRVKDYSRVCALFIEEMQQMVGRIWRRLFFLSSIAMSSLLGVIKKDEVVEFALTLFQFLGNGI